MVRCRKNPSCESNWVHRSSHSSCGASPEAYCHQSLESEMVKLERGNKLGLVLRSAKPWQQLFFVKKKKTSPTQPAPQNYAPRLTPRPKWGACVGGARKELPCRSMSFGTCLRAKSREVSISSRKKQCLKCFRPRKESESFLALLTGEPCSRHLLLGHQHFGTFILR